LHPIFLIKIKNLKQKFKEMKIMNYISTVFSLLLICCFFTFCSNSSKKSYKESQPVFKNETFISPKTKVFIEQVIAPEFMTKIGNVALVTCSRTDTMIYAYHLPDMTYLYGFGIRGGGPDDFTVLPMFCESMADYLYIWGYGPTTIKKFSLSEDNKLLPVKKIRLPFYDVFNFMNIVDDRYVFYFNVDQLQIKKIDLEEDMKAVNLKNKLSEINFDKDPHKESYFYSNRGLMAMNNKYIIYAYIYKNQIDIYNISDLSLHHRLTGSENGLPFRQGKTFDVEYQYYCQLVTTDKYIYACQVNKDKNYILEIYDYEGNPINKYILEIPLSALIIDESNKILVGCNPKDDDYFYIYDIEI
jgi:hypothetical protein